MKKFEKILLAFMLSIAIICTLLPISIFATPEETVTITTESLKDGHVLIFYSNTLEATGGQNIT